MKILLIRHGQTNWNKNGKIQGSCDIELNDEGVLQAEELSRNILQKEYSISKIFSSPQKRAIQTAEILSAAANVKYVLVDDLKEINFGDWEGLTWKEIIDRYPMEYNNWYINRRNTKPPKGESYQDMLQRVLNSIRKIVSEDYSNTIIIVTHSAVIMCIQCYLTNTPFVEMMKFKTENTSITEIDSNLLNICNDRKENL